MLNYLLSTAFFCFRSADKYALIAPHLLITLIVIRNLEFVIFLPSEFWEIATGKRFQNDGKSAARGKKSRAYERRNENSIH